MNKSIPDTSTTDGFELFNYDAYRVGLTMRTQLASLPRFSTQAVQSLLVPLQKKETLQLAQFTPSTKKAALQTVFHALAADLHTATGTYPSRPNQCAHFMLALVYMPLLRSSLAQREHYPEAVVTWYDYASGIAEVAIEIFLAEAERAGLAKQSTKREVAVAREAFSEHLLASFLAEKGYAHLRTKDKHAAQLLSLDPTGETLIAAVVDEIRAEAENTTPKKGITRILAYQNPQLVLAGAAFAQRLYTVLYPLSQ
jgi:hypothetical protein